MYAAYLSLRVHYGTGTTGSQPVQMTGFLETGYAMQEVIRKMGMEEGVPACSGGGLVQDSIKTSSFYPPRDRGELEPIRLPCSFFFFLLIADEPLSQARGDRKEGVYIVLALSDACSFLYIMYISLAPALGYFLRWTSTARWIQVISRRKSPGTGIR